MKFLDMKVKEFIEWIRPITALNPESEIILSNFKVPSDLDIEKIIINSDVTFISLVPHLPKDEE